MKRTIDMLRPNLDGLPPVVVPDGYRLATAADLADPCPGWAEVLNVGFEETGWTPARLQEKFISRPQYDPQGVFFILRGDTIVSTAFAWVDEPDEKRLGRVHFVAVRPEERRKGLGRAVVVAVLHHFRDRGFEQVMLGTQGCRKAAVRLYLSLGFEPWPHTEEERVIWETWLAE